MNEESFESLKEEIIGKPLVGLLFGEPVAVVAIPLDYSPVLVGPDKSRAYYFDPTDVISDWWMEVISAANKRRHEIDSHRHS